MPTSEVEGSIGADGVVAIGRGDGQLLRDQVRSAPTVTEEPARVGLGLLIVSDRTLPIDDDRVIATGALHSSPLASG